MKKNISLLLCCLLLFSIVILNGCEKKDNISINNKEKVKKITLPNEKNNVVDLSIYFDSSKNDKNCEIAKEERLINKEELIGELIVQELIKGPSVESKLKQIFPKNTRLLSFSINDKIAYINLSKEAKIPMRPIKEEACLKSIIWSLTQLPSIEKIKILIESKNIDSLGGNLDISKPIGKDDINNVIKK